MKVLRRERSIQLREMSTSPHTIVNCSPPTVIARLQRSRGNPITMDWRLPRRDDRKPRPVVFPRGTCNGFMKVLRRGRSIQLREISTSPHTIVNNCLPTVIARLQRSRGNLITMDWRLPRRYRFSQ